jgi:hypothetical protein
MKGIMNLSHAIAYTLNQELSNMVDVSDVKRLPDGTVLFEWAEVLPFIVCTGDEDEFILRTGRNYDEVSVVPVALYCEECFSLHGSVLSAMPKEGEDGDLGGGLFCWFGHHIDGQLSRTDEVGYHEPMDR